MSEKTPALVTSFACTARRLRNSGLLPSASLPLPPFTSVNQVGSKIAIITKNVNHSAPSLRPSLSLYQDYYICPPVPLEPYCKVHVILCVYDRGSAPAVRSTHHDLPYAKQPSMGQSARYRYHGAEARKRSV